MTDNTVKLPPPSWPVTMLIHSLYERNMPNIHDDVGVLSAKYILPATRDGTFQLVSMGANVFPDNNCCGSMSVTASQVHVRTIAPSPWGKDTDNIEHLPGAYAESPDSEGRGLTSYARVKDAKLSPWLHVREFDESFPVLTQDQAKQWGRAVLLLSILGASRYWGRGIIRSVDMAKGGQEKILRMLKPLVESSCYACMPTQAEAVGHKPLDRVMPMATKNQDPLLYLRRGGLESRIGDFSLKHGYSVYNYNSGNMIRTTELQRRTEGPSVFDSEPKEKYSFASRDRVPEGAFFASVCAAMQERLYVQYTLRHHFWNYAH